jgi:hypothetical protein
MPVGPAFATQPAAPGPSAISPGDFERLLGQIRTSAPGPLGQCERPNIAAKISFTVAKQTAWTGSAPRVVNGQTLHVANTPVAGTADVVRLRFDVQGAERFVILDFTEDAAKRLAAATSSHVGDYLVVAVNSETTTAKIASAIGGKRLTLHTEHARLEDVCETSAKEAPRATP